MKVEEVKVQKQARVAAHSHVVGLGVDENGTATPVGGGLIGQVKAREVRFVMSSRSSIGLSFLGIVICSKYDIIDV